MLKKLLVACCHQRDLFWGTVFLSIAFLGIGCVGNIMHDILWFQMWLVMTIVLVIMLVTRMITNALGGYKYDSVYDVTFCVLAVVPIFLFFVGGVLNNKVCAMLSVCALLGFFAGSILVYVESPDDKQVVIDMNNSNDNTEVKSERLEPKKSDRLKSRRKRNLYLLLHQPLLTINELLHLQG